ncbi:MAG TPA: hypothetical protein VNZ06_04095 [Steroidobacteraceae bacterium]|jgi:hypothetical protein|nr:hypothetical protein [Steroidobacteraceae bacterium]
METRTDVQQLLRRHREIRQAMRQPGGVRILDERELYAIREQLKGIPAAMQLLQRDATLSSPSMR